MQLQKQKQLMDCGIKVWINKGEILLKDPYASEKNKLIKGVLDNEHVIT